jgi:hypothetical protein
MRRLSSALSACSFACLLVHGLPAQAAGNRECGPPVLAVLGRTLKVAHFEPAPSDFGKDPAGVVLASSCKRKPDEPALTLAAVGWGTRHEDTKGLAVAVVDEAAASVVALWQDEVEEDAATRMNNGSVRLDTAPYELAPGVRAFGLDFFSDQQGCGEGVLGARRTLYVREGHALRPVLQDLAIADALYVRGNQPRCVDDPHDAETAVIETYDVTIALGAPGKRGWRDLALTATAHRDDGRPPRRKPLHVRVPFDGHGYSLDAFRDAYWQWRR